MFLRTLSTRSEVNTESTNIQFIMNSITDISDRKWIPIKFAVSSQKHAKYWWSGESQSYRIWSSDLETQAFPRLNLGCHWVRWDVSRRTTLAEIAISYCGFQNVLGMANCNMALTNETESLDKIISWLGKGFRCFRREKGSPGLHTKTEKSHYRALSKSLWLTMDFSIFSNHGKGF